MFASNQVFLKNIWKILFAAIILSYIILAPTLSPRTPTLTTPSTSSKTQKVPRGLGLTLNSCGPLISVLILFQLFIIYVQWMIWHPTRPIDSHKRLWESNLGECNLDENIPSLYFSPRLVMNNMNHELFVDHNATPVRYYKHRERWMMVVWNQLGML